MTDDTAEASGFRHISEVIQLHPRLRAGQRPPAARLGAHVDRKAGILAAHDYLMRKELTARSRLQAVLTWAALAIIAFLLGLFFAAAMHKAEADLEMFYRLEAMRDA